MNVLFISECEGRALKDTRRILDQFAERRGVRTWQTAITQDGLDTVRKLLRKTARKNTAVACHWIRGKDHSELLWTIGDQSHFGENGAVPTNTTVAKKLRVDLENNWHSLTDIYLLSALAALLHDLGKACKAFQERLRRPELLEKNLYRHEWISLCLFESFVGNAKDDQEWLKRLISHSDADVESWTDKLVMDPAKMGDHQPFLSLPPLAKAIGWLVLTHHRLPQGDATFSERVLDELPDCIKPRWNQTTEGNSSDPLPYWTFEHGLPVSTNLWNKRASKIATRLLERSKLGDHKHYLDDQFIMHLSRLCLMLADHHYSSLTSDGRVCGEKNYPLFANTTRKEGSEPTLNQCLDEHLLGVESFAGKVSYMLPTLVSKLPRLANHRKLKQRSKSDQFRWQDTAADRAMGISREAQDNGAFIVNMASTGCGKTLANARIMYALSDKAKGWRCAFALGLRTLTKQTGKEYRQKLGLSDEDVAILVGGYETDVFQNALGKIAELSGSESSQELMPEDGYVIYDGAVESETYISKFFSKDNAQKLLSAPILSCTIDHLVPATEGTRGGRQIAPMLRLLSGDLVLDELDDYDILDLPAVSRLVNWAGLLGCRVLISSATLPPAVVIGMFDAYKAGRMVFNQNRARSERASDFIPCMFVDEFTCIASDVATAEEFNNAHQKFAEKRYRKLQDAQPKRLGLIVDIKRTSASKEAVLKDVAQSVLESALVLHQQHNQLDPVSGKTISFGLVRMANIDPLVQVAQNLYKLSPPADTKIHLCTYHSQHLQFMRSNIEQHLDQILDRRDPDRVFGLAPIRRELNQSCFANHIFMVLASPVAEVGRDHDYDWAIVEPSSERSIIQLAGRIKRHRPYICSQPNILLLSQNIKGLRGISPSYTKPGFEDSGNFKLNSSMLRDLLSSEELPVIDSRPRIRERCSLNANGNLADLEHARLKKIMLPEKKKSLSASSARAGKPMEISEIQAHSWWCHPKSSLSALLQNAQRFRKSQSKEIDLVFIPNEVTNKFELHEITKDSYKTKLTKVDSQLLHRIDDGAFANLGVVPWCHATLNESIERLPDELDIDLIDCARKYARVCLPTFSDGSTVKWQFHPYIGFSRYVEPKLL